MLYLNECNKIFGRFDFVLFLSNKFNLRKKAHNIDTIMHVGTSIRGPLLLSKLHNNILSYIIKLLISLYKYNATLRFQTCLWFYLITVNWNLKLTE